MGSGTTLIAAETIGRRCLGVELNPAYVDVAIRRWQAFAGQQARLGESGPTFNEIAATRRASGGAGGDGDCRGDAGAPEAGAPGDSTENSARSANTADGSAARENPGDQATGQSDEAPSTAGGDQAIAATAPTSNREA